ncbi:hypothetical protein BVW01_23505, partial [Mycobacterium tuberculosis]
RSAVDGGARERAPSALRAKGVASESPALTYSGPAEDGSAQVQRNGGGAHAARSMVARAKELQVHYAPRVLPASRPL